MNSLQKKIVILAALKTDIISPSKWIGALILSLAFSCVCMGQGSDPSSMIYRGRVAIPPPPGYNGTPYWDTTGFRPGRAMFNGRLYGDVLLRVDASAGLVHVRPGMSYAPSIPERDQLSWIERDGVRFVNLQYQGIKGAESGFYEVVFDGSDALLRRVNRRLRTGSGDHRQLIGYSDPNYNPSYLSYYDYSEDFYLLSKNGGLTKLDNKNSIARIFRSRAAELRRHMRAAGLTGIGVSRRAYFHEAFAFLDEGGPGALEGLVVNWHPVEGSGTDVRTPAVAAPRPESLRAVLPDGYFEERDESDALSEAGSGLDVTFRNKVYTIGQKRERPAASARVHGTVMDGQFDEPLPGVVVSDSLSGAYTTTDSEGRWALDLPVGPNVLNFMETSKEDVHLMVVVNGEGELNLTMNARVTELDAAMISDETRMNHRTAQMGLEHVSVKTLNKIPTAFGEGDVIKAVLTLPGVKTVGEASGGFNVRGGSSDQNLVLFNEGTIYNSSHLFGIFSSFNPDVVADVNLYKSSIPAEYGGRISSVLTVDGKTGDIEKIKGSLGIGLLTSRFHLEGPLAGKGRTTFLLGGRTTYSDWLLKQIPADSYYAGGTAGFYDANLTLSHVFDASNSLQVFGYYSRDRFAFNEDDTFRYANLNAALRYNHTSSGGTQMTLAAGVDYFGNRLDDYANTREAYTLNTAINQAFARLKFKTSSLSGHTLSYGFNATVYGLDGGILNPLGEHSMVVSDNLGREYAVEPALYLSDSWHSGEKLALEGGARLSGFMNLSDSYLNIFPEFRLSGKWSFTPMLSVKAGFNTLRQNIHLISNSAAISPLDTWKLTDSRIKPTDGWQAASGLYWTVFNGRLDLSLEGYYKRMTNYLDYKGGATLSMNRNLSDDLVPTRGKAYGVEFMAKKTVGKLTGWLTYTYSRTLLQEMGWRGIATINDGEWYPASFDKPHDVKFVGNFAITRRYSISVNVDYSTGRPVTLPVGIFTYGGGNRLLYSERNGYRLPDYFRLDMAVNIDPGHYLKALLHSSVTIGCYNVTGRRNAYSVYYTTGGGGEVTGHMVSVFAVPVPYVNINILF